MPVAAARLLRSSNVVSESKPRSWNAWPGSISAVPEYPRTAATLDSTRSSTTRPRSAAGSPASRPRSSGSPVPTAATAVLSTASSARTSGRSASKGIRRVAETAGANRAQSTSAAVTAVSSDSIARRSAEIAMSVGSGSNPPRRMRAAAAAASATMPDSAHGPQATDVAVSPRSRRCSANASSQALAAA